MAKFPAGALDDLTLDADGNFYVCLWGNKKIMKVAKDGKTELFLDGVDGPSAVEFGQGPQAHKLFILVKGATLQFKGTQIITVETGAVGYRLPFLP